MINKDHFYHLNEIVSKAVKDAFTAAYQNASLGDYYLFLASADANDTEDTKEKYPFVYDYQVDNLNMANRIQFLEEYVNNKYSSNCFPTTDDLISLTFELLLYMQMWGEKSFLKKLHRLASLCEGKNYEWEVTVYKTGMHKFISYCRMAAENNGLAIAEIIHESYLSQIRDAAAHNEYYITSSSIVFTNYEGKSYQIPFENTNDWTLRFVKSFLLYYHLFKEFMNQRESLNIGKHIPVQLKNADGNYIDGHILYDGSSFHIITK